MRVEYAFIAEAADAVGGFFYVLKGGSDLWKAPPGTTFPLNVGPMSFVVRVIGEPDQVGLTYPVDFTVVDADGRSIGVSGTGEIEFPPHPVDRTRAGGALIHFRLPVQVPSPGAYFFELHAFDKRLCQVPFWILPPDEE